MIRWKSWKSPLTIEFTVILSSRISPEAPISTVLLKSPCATALVTEAISRTCSVKFCAMRLTDSV